jgi:hypothetical protein
MRRPVGVSRFFTGFIEQALVLSPRGRCRYASIRTLEERFVSLAAHWASSLQPVLLSVWRSVVLFLQSGTWARPLTQSPELGFGSLTFLFLERFRLCFAFCLTLLQASSATQYQLLRSPKSNPTVNFCPEIFLLGFAATMLTFFVAGLLLSVP